MERPLKVVITAPWAERLGGAENMLWTLLRHLDRTRIEPVVVFLQPGPFADEVSSLGIRTEAVASARLRNVGSFVGTMRRLAAILQLERPDLVLNWSAKTQLYGAPAATLAGLRERVVWWQHSIPTAQWLDTGQWLDRLATMLPTRAVGCSSQHAAEAQRRLRPRRRTFVVHPGVDPVEPPDAEEVVRFRAELGIPPGRPVVGIVGRLEPGKAQHHLIGAVSELRHEGIDVHGLVVGGNAWDLAPGYEQGLKRLAAQLGLGEAVTFTGQVPDATPYIAAMDVLVNASEAESFGIVLLEAMRLGVPVVAAAGAGPLEVVEDGVSGVLVAPGDLGRGGPLRRLVTDAQLRARMGREARRRVGERFGSRAMARKFESEMIALIADEA